MRSSPNGTSAATTTTTKPITPTARPSGGSHSHSPSQDSARNKPIAVASVASAGHSRSQRIVQRARRSAAARSDLAAGSAASGADSAVVCSVTIVRFPGRQTAFVRLQLADNTLT